MCNIGSIIKKKVKKYTYYYYVESARVNGKPRIVNQKYLGSADEIVKSIKTGTGIPNPEYSIVLEFGAVCALYDLASRLGIVSLVNKHVPKRKQGLSIGEYILLAAINRAVQPKNKSVFFEWFERTVLPKFFPACNKKTLSSQGFWENMSLIKEDAIQEIEEELSKEIVTKYKLNTECLVYDTTNFFTYIDTSNPSKLAQRGNSKEKRTDLKIIGLAIMASQDNNIPLFHETYPGNDNDAKEFAAVVERLKDRYRKIAGNNNKLTLVFDKGNNSDDNLKKLFADDESEFHVVGSLRLNQCNKLLEVPKGQFKPLEGEKFKGATSFRTLMEVYNKEMTIIVVFNPELIEAQIEGVENNIKKCINEFTELKSRLDLRSQGKITKGKKPTVESVKKNITRVLSLEHMEDIFDHTITETPKGISIEYNLNKSKYDGLKERVLGKTILYTDRSDWVDEQIVSAYRSQYHVEECFKQMKNTKRLSFRPLHHWTDDKIRVHAFYCVLALRLCCLLNKELENHGYKMSINRMLELLSDVKQVISIFPAEKKPERFSLSRYDGETKELIGKLDLLRYQIQ